LSRSRRSRLIFYRSVVETSLDAAPDLQAASSGLIVVNSNRARFDVRFDFHLFSYFVVDIKQRRVLGFEDGRRSHVHARKRGEIAGSFLPNEKTEQAGKSLSVPSIPFVLI
jgi:hypothetical protein